MWNIDPSLNLQTSSTCSDKGDGNVTGVAKKLLRASASHSAVRLLRAAPPYTTSSQATSRSRSKRAIDYCHAHTTMMMVATVVQSPGGHLQQQQQTPQSNGKPQGPQTPTTSPLYKTQTATPATNGQLQVPASRRRAS